MSSTLTNLTHKQLFLTDYTIKGKEILITNPDLLNQVRKVLRLQKSAKSAKDRSRDGWAGDIIYVQNEWIRYEVEIKDWDDKTLMWNIKAVTSNEWWVTRKDKLVTSNSERVTGMIIGMPNKWEKVELIVQKLTEIWLDEIIFRPSERSVIKTWNENKAERLMKIAREAVEQSRGRKLPTVTFTTNLKEKLQNCEVIVFDKRLQMADSRRQEPAVWALSSVFWLVGPEWWLMERDYEVLKWVNFEVRELGETMLRTETAAIVGGWIVKNKQTL